MSIEVTDVGIEKQSASASSPSEELSKEGTMEQQQPHLQLAAAAAGGRRGWLTRPLEANSWLPRPPEAGQEAESLLHSFLSNREGESALC